MSIEVVCQCGKRLKVNDNLAGKRIRCKGCERRLTVPESADEPPPRLRPVPTEEEGGQPTARGEDSHPAVPSSSSLWGDWVIPFRSVPVKTETYHMPDKKVTKTTYEISAAEKHVLVCPRWKVIFHWTHLYRVPALTLGLILFLGVILAIGCLLWYQFVLHAEMPDRETAPFWLLLVFRVVLPLLSFCLACFTSGRIALENMMRAMSQEARRRRDLVTVEESNWESFLTTKKTGNLWPD